MYRYILLAIVAVLMGGFFVPAFAWDSLDSITGNDKMQHFAVSAVVAATADQVIYHNSESLDGWKRPISAFAIGMVPGLVKEGLDSQEDGNKWSWEDIQFDALGCLYGTVLSEGFNRAMEHYYGWQPVALTVSADRDYVGMAVAVRY